MMQGALTDDFGANELLIQAHGGRTLDMSSDESSIFRDAYQSLIEPPTTLPDEKRLSLTRKHMPHLAYPKDDQDAPYLAQHKRSEVRRKTSLSVDQQGETLSLCKQYVAYAGNTFEVIPFLELFSFDPYRFVEETNIHGLLPLLLMRQDFDPGAVGRAPSTPLKDAKTLLLLAMVIRAAGSQKLRGLELKMSHICHPGLLRALVLGGSDLIQDAEPGPIHESTYLWRIIRGAHIFGVHAKENRETLSRRILSFKIALQATPDAQSRDAAISYLERLSRNPSGTRPGENRWAWVLTEAITDAFLERFPDLASSNQ